ncbi:MAG: hypothetical protein H0V62_02785 [Gammaproteobacteria bacterium]|nr:hypothetical protein [Gammaproteobacteria bacterium]
MVRAGAVALLVSFASQAGAVDIDIINPDQEAFRGVSEDLAAAFSYKTLNPTEPLGLIGFNVGIIGSYTSVKNEQAFADLVGEEVNQFGTAGIGVTKGLPLGFDIGAFYSADPSNSVRSYGGEIRYAFVPGNVVLPAIGARVAGTNLEGIDQFSMQTLSVDVSASKGFAFFTPYAGVGQVFAFSNPDEEIGLDDEKFNDTRVYGGARLTFLPFQLTGEVDNVGGATSFNLRVAVGL